jgi:hypothetical protein
MISAGAPALFVYGPCGRDELVDISSCRIIELDRMPCTTLPCASKFNSDPGGPKLAAAAAFYC